MTTAVAYLRVSSAEQVKNTSLDDQAARTKKHIESRGWKLLRTFREEGKSAKDGDRPQLKALLRFCQETEVDYVVALDMTRLSRNTEVYLTLRRQLSALGTKFSFVSFDPGDSIEGEFMSTIQAAVAEFDNRQRGLKAKRGMEAVERQGGWLTRAPRGYRNVRKNGIPSLEPDEETAYAVRKAFQDVADGRRDPVEAAKSVGVGSAHTNDFFARPVFAGYNRVDGQLVKATWEGLVTLATWQRVQERMRHRVTHSKHDCFWLRGFLKCECGQMLTASFSKGKLRRYGYYHCRKCGARHPATAMEKSFKTWLDDLGRQNADVLVKVKQAAIADLKLVFAESEASKKRAAAEADRIEKRLSALVDLHITGGLSREEYDSKREELVGKRNEAQLEYLSGSISANQFLDLLDTAARILENFSQFLGVAGYADLMIVVRALVGSTVTVSPSGKLSNTDPESLYWLNSMLCSPNSEMVCLKVGLSNTTLRTILARLRVAREILASVLERRNSKEA